MASQRSAEPKIPRRPVSTLHTAQKRQDSTVDSHRNSPHHDHLAFRQITSNITVQSPSTKQKRETASSIRVDDSSEDFESTRPRDESTFKLINVQGQHEKSHKSSTTTKRNPTKSWRAPVVMIASLLCGLILAVIHHQMNTALQGQLVYSFGLLTQQWTSRYGTALAFLARMAFVICVGEAFVQRLFLSFATRKQPVQIKDFDSVSGVLGNFLSFFGSITLYKNPHLLLIAAVSWTIPLAAVVTPGSLTVLSLPKSVITQQSVPRLSFNSTSYATVRQVNIRQDMRETPQMTRAAFAAGIGGTILSMNATNANQTYTLNFFGPALKCQAANKSATLEASSAAGQFSGGDAFAAYVGTPPWDWARVENGGNGDETGAFAYIVDQSDFNSLERQGLMNETLGNAIWVMSRLGVQNNVYGGNLGFWAVNLTECRLQNASYEVEFSFVDSVQQTNVRNLVYMNPSYITNYPNSNPSTLLTEDDGPPGWTTQRGIIISYKAILSAFGRLLVGRAYENQWGRVNDGNTHWDLLDIDFTRAEKTHIGLEELFQNITLSMFSVPQFLSNSTETVAVTVTTWGNTYVYDSTALWYAYGLAILASLLCGGFGLHACMVSSGSYQNVFSTHVRAAYLSNLDTDTFIEDEKSAMDPLPAGLKRRVMIMGCREP